jgi:3-oxoacyl-[acyl-carrier protein] reductase
MLLGLSVRTADPLGGNCQHVTPSERQPGRRTSGTSARLLAEYGRWDVLMNNAAVAITKPFGEITDDDYDLSFAVNVKGVFNGLQLALRHLADNGRIITISSSTTGLMLPGYAIYDGTKGAVEQFTRILCKEFGSRGITVNAVRPGATKTETYRNGKSEQFLASLEAMSAFGRLGRPDEIASVVTFLASDAAGWVTGQNIGVNGGTT